MEGRFEVTFPLVLEWDDSISITFTLQRGHKIAFTDGIYYLDGDNGSGKTTFISMLSLTAGQIGKGGGPDRGTVIFNGEAFNGKGFDCIRAAEIREKYFCIFPQKTFFLPVSTRDNYQILNGSDPIKAKTFSSRQYPDLLSGGQQQKILMDIVLDDKRPVWFLDEPLTNLDAERRHYFWKTLKRAYEKAVSTVFFIDHWMGDDIKRDRHFLHENTLRVFMENRQAGHPGDIEFKQIDLYVNHCPEEFFKNQISKIESEKSLKKMPGALCLRGDWGVAADGQALGGMKKRMIV